MYSSCTPATNLSRASSIFNKLFPRRMRIPLGKTTLVPPRPKERVVGARKIWGTLRTTTSNAVSSTLSKLTSKGNQVQVKRKFKSIQNTNKTVRWWFVIRGSEDMLQDIDSEWDHVSAQTNWKLEPLLKFPDPVDVHDNPPYNQNLILVVITNHPVAKRLF